MVIRVRPLLDLDQPQQTCVHVESAVSVEITKANEDGKTHQFTFDRVFDQPVEQVSLYKACVRDVVLDTLAGYNGSIIAYGQTGSGKTFTMEGGPGDARGVIPRASEEIFNFIENSSDAQSKFLVRVSFLQVRWVLTRAYPGYFCFV